MSTRLSTIARGRAGTNQSYSTAFLPDAAKAAKILSTVKVDTTPARRGLLLADPTVTFQFIIRWGDHVGLLTRPVLSQHRGEDDEQFVVGNFTDAIGQVTAVELTYDHFMGRHSTLVPRGFAERFNLPVCAKAPDTVRGRGGPGIRVASIRPGMERLNWPHDADDGEEWEPVIALMPNALAVPPGTPIPHMVLLDEIDLSEIYPLGQVWVAGQIYGRANNEDKSVTVDGPLFDPDHLELEENEPDIFDEFDISETFPSTLRQLPPSDPKYHEVSEASDMMAEMAWLELGGRITPANTPQGERLNSEAIRNIVEPLVAKDKENRLYGRTLAKLRIFLAGEPLDPTGMNEYAHLPELLDSFDACLKNSNSAIASDELRELTRTVLELYSRSKYSLDKDTTLHCDVVTGAFSDCIRTFRFLDRPLVGMSRLQGERSLGLLQLLTPVQETLSVTYESDYRTRAIVMANASNNSALLEATKASKLYTQGHLESFRHVYEGICNFRALVTVMMGNPDRSILVGKLVEYGELLTSEPGKCFWSLYKRTPYLPVHPFQDVQHMISAFAKVASHTELYQGVLEGGSVTRRSFKTATEICDGHISGLRTILHGSGLGTYRDTPACHGWFPRSGLSVARAQTKVERMRGGSQEQSPPASSPSGATNGSAPASKKPRTTYSPEDCERLKGFGVIRFDTNAPGANPRCLDTCPVKAKRKGAKVADRLCMRYLVVGETCRKPDAESGQRGNACHLPHVPNLATLPEKSRRSMIEYVKKTPGLSWVEGKEPAGTN